MSQSLVGQLLIASPLMTDGVFARSVCLVMHHDEEGSIGVLLNRPLQPQPTELWNLLDLQTPRPSTSSGSVHFGGPLSGPVVALHRRQQWAEAETGNGVYVAAQKEHLQQLIREKGPFRLIVGHAGWGAGQLEAEVARGSWYTLPATPEVVFAPEGPAWSVLVRRAGTVRLASWIGCRHLPLRPEYN
jgi:putative transcriptional regulator